MSQVTRWILSVFGVIIIIVISIVGTAFWCFVHSDLRPSAPLTAGLHGPWAVLSTEFDRRVKAKFPLGSSEMDIETELQHQGFSRQDWYSGPVK